MVDGRSVYTHERLRRARSGLVRLANAGTLFTYLGPRSRPKGRFRPRTTGSREA